MQVGAAGVVHTGIQLGHNADQLFISLERIHERHGGFAPNRQRSDASWE
jgi:hypothetical protein